MRGKFLVQSEYYNQLVYIKRSLVSHLQAWQNSSSNSEVYSSRHCTVESKCKS